MPQTRRKGRGEKCLSDPRRICLCARCEAEDEETLVFALRDPDSDLKGTYTVAFGPNMDALDADTLVLLK